MISLKRFMVWDTASNRTPKQRMFQSLRSRLLLSYLTVMAAILTTSGAAVYVFFTRSLDQQLNQRLLTLAQAAVPSLEAVENEGLQSLNREVPWRELFKRSQSLEWFNAEGKLLARKGTNFSTLGLNPASQVIQQQGQIRTLTIAVYAHSPNRKTLRLEGHIRASETTREAEAIVKKLGIGLGLGGTMALVFSGIGGMWLTQQVLQPIEQSFQRLKQFTADASHELRSPLTAINTATEVMQNHPERIHPLDVKKLAAIASATNQLIALAEDLLFLARSDATVTPPSVVQKSLPLDKVLEDLVRLFEPQAKAKGIAFTSSLLAGISVKGDAAQLKRLFSNLLENALKYTAAEGSVVLSVTTRNWVAVVQVEDTGVGIAPEHLPFIFQRFWRADKARFRQVEGSGLGLAIAQVIAQQHGGKITVSSQLGRGSFFQVYLPLIYF